MPSNTPNDKPRFNFRVTPDQYDRISALAKAANQNASEYARERVLLETPSSAQIQQSLLERVLAVEAGIAAIQSALSRIMDASAQNAELAAAGVAASSLLRDTGQTGAEDKVADHIDVALSAARHVMAMHKKGSSQR